MCHLRLKLCVAIIFSAGIAAADNQTGELVDHHLHVLSPQLIADWKGAGARFSRDDESYSNPIKFCADNGVSKGFLVSMAHLYSTEEFGLDAVKQLEKVSAENNFVANCVKAAPDRFVGFFSVNPLRDWATVEMERCRNRPELKGLKLHFPACDVDFLDKIHMEKLRRVFNWSVKHKVPILVHVSGFERPFTRVEARLFWQQLVKPHASLHLYLAHVGTSGGYNERARILFDEYRNLLKNKEFKNDNIYFDMSGAILAEPIDGVEATSDELCKELAEQISDIGVEHFVFASDYPVFSPGDFLAALRKRVPLEPQIFAKLLANKSPLFQAASHH